MLSLRRSRMSQLVLNIETEILVLGHEDYRGIAYFFESSEP